MSKGIWFLCLSFTLLSGIARADDSAQEVFEKVKAAARRVDYAQLEIRGNIDLVAFSTSTKERECIVTLHSEIAKQAYPEELAAIVGHELAHCLLRHHRLIDPDKPGFQQRAWADEYAADALGLKLAIRAGYDARELFEGFLVLLPEDIMHPSGLARVAALHGKPRELPPGDHSLNELLWKAFAPSP